MNTDGRRVGKGREGDTSPAVAVSQATAPDHKNCSRLMVVDLAERHERDMVRIKRAAKNQASPREAMPPVGSAGPLGTIRKRIARLP